MGTSACPGQVATPHEESRGQTAIRHTRSPLTTAQMTFGGDKPGLSPKKNDLCGGALVGRLTGNSGYPLIPVIHRDSYSPKKDKPLVFF